MNNSNNVSSNNNIPTPQPNNLSPTIGVNNNIPMPQSNNISSSVGVNNPNNTVSTQLQTEPIQMNQAAPIQSQNNFNTGLNTPTINNNVNSIPVNTNSVTYNNTIPVSSQLESNLVNQTINNTPNTANTSTNMSINQNTASKNNIVNNQLDDELLKAFIGKNYEKITKKQFNFAGFFFTTLYMLYRKMFLYSIIAFLLNILILNVFKQSLLIIVFNIAIGLLINKIYLGYAKKKVANIKANNKQKSVDELKGICTSKGGTSIGQLFLGLILQVIIAFFIIISMAIIGIGGAFAELFNSYNGNADIEKTVSKKGSTLIENVIVNGYACYNSNCFLSIDENGVTTDYALGFNNELMQKLVDYKEYIKLNIYYKQKDEDKIIVDYKLFLKSNEEDITNIVKNENELREKIGLYTLGVHTDTFTLKEIGTAGGGFKDNVTYSYRDYTFINDKNIELEMSYINNDGDLNVIEGNKYTVTFEVTEGIFHYEYNIKSVK